MPSSWPSALPFCPAQATPTALNRLAPTQAPAAWSVRGIVFGDHQPDGVKVTASHAPPLPVVGHVSRQIRGLVV